MRLKINRIMILSIFLSCFFLASIINYSNTINQNSIISFNRNNSNKEIEYKESLLKSNSNNQSYEVFKENFDSINSHMEHDYGDFDENSTYSVDGNLEMENQYPNNQYQENWNSWSHIYNPSYTSSTYNTLNGKSNLTSQINSYPGDISAQISKEIDLSSFDIINRYESYSDYQRLYNITYDFDYLYNPPTLDGYYKAKYNFRYDDLYLLPKDWSKQAGGYYNTFVVDSIDGHDHVLNVQDNDDLGVFSANQIFTKGEQEYGSIEFWYRSTDTTKWSEFAIRHTNVAIYLRISGASGGADNRLQIFNFLGYTDVCNVYSNNWYRIRIDFECGNNNYKGLLPQTYNIFCYDKDNNLLGAQLEISFLIAGSSLSQLQFNSSPNESGFNYSVDAVGYSWDNCDYGEQYEIGDNMVLISDDTYPFYSIFNSNYTEFNITKRFQKWNHFSKSIEVNASEVQSIKLIFNMTNGKLQIENLTYTITFRCLSNSDAINLSQYFKYTPNFDPIYLRQVNTSWILNFTYDFSSDGLLEPYETFNSVNNSKLLISVHLKANDTWIDPLNYNYNNSISECFSLNITDEIKKKGYSQFNDFYLEIFIAGANNKIILDNLILYYWNPISDYNYVYYCSSEQEIINAIASIGDGKGTIYLISKNIPLSRTLNINLGGEYIILGLTGLETLIMANTYSVFTIEYAQICNLKNFQINSNLEQASTPTIIINEKENNPIYIENISISGDFKKSIGILINSNEISLNYCSINGTNIGILLNESLDCTLYQNKLTKNILGINLTYYSQNNLFYKNYFIANNLHAEDNSLTPFSNKWDNSHVGNYWDNYTELGAQAVDSDLDGIGDINYTVSGTAKANDTLPIFGNPFFNGQRIHVIGIETTGLNSWQYISTRAWCNGLGTIAEPYMFQDLTIDGGAMAGDSCIWIEDSISYFTIENCHLTNSRGEENSYAAIKLDDVNYGKIRNNTIFDNLGTGIYLKNCFYIDILNNQISDNDLSGIYITAGASPSESRFVNITRNTIKDNIDHGIYLTGILNGPLYITQNTIDSNGKNGIRINVGTHIDIYKNTIINNGEDGLYLTVSSQWNTLIQGNKFQGNKKTFTDLGSDNEIKWNVINGIVEQMIIDDTGMGDFTWQQVYKRFTWVSGSGTQQDPYFFQDVQVRSSDGSHSMIIRDSAHFFVIEGCSFSNASNGAGLYIEQIEYCNISSIVSNDNYYGIVLDHSNYTTVKDSYFIGNFDGICEIESHNNQFINTVEQNRGDSPPDTGDDDSDSNDDKPWIIINIIIIIIISSIGGGAGVGAVFHAMNKHKRSIQINKDKEYIQFTNAIGVTGVNSMKNDPIPDSLYEGMTDSQITLENKDKKK